ncbi:MAG: non-hydrolyzing UDP-N-acetylglucosamine 2-epimerase [Calditrichaceae bacterium]
MTLSKKIMFIFGTRPEAIKMAPVIKKFSNKPDIKPVVVVTAQHREMLDQVLNIFNIKPDYDLGIMRDNQSLEDITILALRELSDIIKLEKPAIILVQGDTTTTFVGALSALYNKIPIGHIEAGLRTFDKFQPYPEEINRKLTTVLADVHFPPTKQAAENLRNEGVRDDLISITGNTVIDTLLEVVDRKFNFTDPLKTILSQNNSRVILVTAHRRESFGEPLVNILSALKEIAERAPDVQILFPVHPNPNIKNAVYKQIGGNPKIHLIDPLDYESFVHLMNKSYLIITDSGGVQEEAPSLGKPVLVLRNKTERPEAVEAGTVKLVGSDYEVIVSESLKLLSDKDAYNSMARAINPYGDGKASERIFKIITERFLR